jgi:hypothetical protein
MTSVDSGNHLSVLRDRLRSRTMSVLVGAGFSKNASSSDFPTWNELLRKLVISFRTASILEQYRRLKMDYSIKSDDLEFAMFLDGEIASYIESTGYLKVVSEYIRYTGIRESIDSFIEENTPTVVDIDNCDYLQRCKDGQIELVELAPGSLDLHGKLINFPWNNVYTTNYDNLLEYCVDKKVSNKIEQKIIEIENEIIKLSTEYEKLEVELNELNDEITVNNDEILNPPPSTSSITRSKPTKILDEKTRKQADLQWNLENLIGEISDLSNSRSQYRRSLDDCYAVVSRSSQLSLKKHRNIIKLHGTIDRENEHFSFDDDIHKRYVISSEDYESYPTKHEAFTQLMRISLLQDYFMLIGFSGDDPNFLAWVSWVRDVIQRGTNPDKIGKIFLVDVNGNGDISRYKQQFYRNHQIVHIPLSSPQVLDFLSNHHGSTLSPSDFRGILSAFLDYLSEHAPYNPSQVAVEKLYRADYEAYFRRLPVYFDKNTTVDLSGLVKDKSIIETTRQYCRMTSIQSPFTYSKALYLNSFDEILAQHPEALDDLLDAAIACLVDIHIPFRSMINQHSILIEKIEERLMDYENCGLQLQWLQVYNMLWHEDLDTLSDWVNRSTSLPTDVKNQMLCLGNLFEFNFSDALNILKTWSAAGHWAVVKAGFESHTNIDAAKKQLKGATNWLVQERLLGIELQLVLAGFGREERLREMYKQMEYDGLKHVHGMIESLLRDVLPGRERIEVRGSNKFISGDGLHLSNVSKERSSLQIFGLLIESGFPLSTGRTILYGFQEIFPAIVASIPFYPIPVLFYAIQYDETPFLKRVGQEYAYEQKVDFYHKRILRSLLVAYSSPNTPARFKANSLFFLCEFVIAIDPALWQDLFSEIWNEAFNTLTPLKDSRSPSMQFIAKSLPLVQNSNVTKQVLMDCLSMVGRPDVVSATISCSYYLQLNPHFRENASTVRKALCDNIFSNLITSAQTDYNYLIVIGNLSEILNKEDKKAVISFLRNLDFASLEPVLLEVILSLLDRDSATLRKKLVSSLVRNLALWRTGLSDTRPGVVGPAPFIKLRVLRKQAGWTGLNGSQVASMYHKLSEELLKISNFMKKHSIGGLVDFRSNLQEMLWFLEDEVVLLKDQPDLNQVHSIVDDLFLKSMHGVADIDALMSDDLVNINWVLLRISRDLKDYQKVMENDDKIRQVIARVSMKNLVGLESCIFHLATWFYDLRNTDRMKPYMQPGLRMLSQYKSDGYPAGCEISLIEEKLIQLAYVFRLWGDCSDIVIHFCEMLQSSRFNNVRHTLWTRLKGDGILVS